MSVINISLLEKNLDSFIDNVIAYNEAIVVNTKRGNAVIVAEEDYNAMLEKIHLVSQSGLAEKIKEGEKEDLKSMKVYNPLEEW